MSTSKVVSHAPTKGLVCPNLNGGEKHEEQNETKRKSQAEKGRGTFEQKKRFQCKRPYRL